MRHSVFGRKLSRTKNERRRLFAGLVRDVVLHNAVTTTVAKAKAVQPLLEKLVTKAKEGTENSRRAVEAVVTDRKIVSILFEDAKTRFANRTSGFTRIIKSGIRRGDSTDTAILSFVDEKVVVEVIKATKTEVKKTDVKKTVVKSKTVKKTAKKE